MADGAPAGLSRAVHATASPRRRPSIAGYERAQARRERRRLGVVALAVALGLVVLALFVLWEWRKATGVTYSHWGPLGSTAGNDYDEGAYVISAQLLLKGYPLFHSVFSAQPAFFLPSLAAVVRTVGNPVVAGHVYEALFGVATLVGVFWMGWTAYRPLAGPLAAALLALLSPADQLRQVVALHLAASRVLPLDAAANAQALKVFLGYDPGLLLVAVAGAILALLWGRNRYLPLVYALWFLSTLIFLWRYHPFIQHQFVPLLPPLALLGAALATPAASSQ